MRKYSFVLIGVLFCFITAKSEPKAAPNLLSAKQNIMRAIELVNHAIPAYFVGDQMVMARYYNPYTEKRSHETASIWMYTSAIEAINALLRSVKALGDAGDTMLHDRYFDDYTPYTYNSGTMLSGATDLYRITGKNHYLEDAKKLSEASFSYFAKQGVEITGYYSYEVGGFRNWFNGVLMRAYVEFQPYHVSVSEYIATFQQNLDYGYDNFLYKGFLPSNLLMGWDNDISKNDIEGMFSFAFAAEYALLAQFELKKRQ